MLVGPLSGHVSHRARTVAAPIHGRRFRDRSVSSRVRGSDGGRSRGCVTTTRGLVATVMLDRFMAEPTRIRLWLLRLERASGVLVLRSSSALLITDAMLRLAELGTSSPS